MSVSTSATAAHCRGQFLLYVYCYGDNYNRRLAPILPFLVPPC